MLQRIAELIQSACGLGLVSDVPLNGRQVQDWNMPTIRNLAYCKQGQAETEDDRSTLEVAIFAHVNHVEVRPRQPVGWGFNPDMWLTATLCK